MAQAPLVNFVNMLVIITCKQQISAGKLTCSFLIIIHHLRHDLDSSYIVCVCIQGIMQHIYIQRNHSITDTIGDQHFVPYI